MGALTAWAFAGQGSQRKGMGAELFDRFPDRVAAADAILGWSIRDLCLNNPDGRLRLTQNAQPAIYVVSALHFFALQEPLPDFLAGHSVGEYTALLAAGCFDFETGLRLVQKRGELMGRAAGGGMVAVIGVPIDRITEVLPADVDVANYNSPRQIVLSGPKNSLAEASQAIGRLGGRCVPLDVSAAFHSRYMSEASTAFAEYLKAFAFDEPRVPVISNVTGEPYPKGAVAELLVKQITSPVRWLDVMRYLQRADVRELREIGTTRVLSDLWKETPPPVRVAKKSNGAESLGSAAFREDYGLRYAYLAGSMFRGVASVALVVRMARAGLMGFLGTGGMTLEEIDAALRDIKRQLGSDRRYGANLLHQMDDPAAERAQVELFLRHDVRCVEAAAFMQITPALLQFRFSGGPRRVVAKVSRPEVATAFMQPAPEAIVRKLVEEGSLTQEEGELARRLPVSQDICVESDSAGHTDGGVALTLIPVMTRLRDELMERHRYHDRIRIGASGGLGAPEAVAAVFVLGAEFVVTGSVNQCSPEAGTSAAVKDMLAGLDVQDTGYAPAGDMFEMGARVQVMKKGTLFTPRANKLYQLYRQHDSLDAIERQTRQTIESTYFRRSFDDVWRDTRDYLVRSNQPSEIEKAERNPRQRMARVFRWYFAHSIQVALEGNLAEKVNFQVHCGPAMGAFNRFVKGSDLEQWQNRHVDTIADRLMDGAAAVLQR